MNKLKYKDRVKIHSTTDPKLYGNLGTLIGVASAFPENTFWIVELDTPQPDYKAIVLTDACLQYFGNS